MGGSLLPFRYNSQTVSNGREGQCTVSLELPVFPRPSTHLLSNAKGEMLDVHSVGSRFQEMSALSSTPVHAAVRGWSLGIFWVGKVCLVSGPSQPTNTNTNTNTNTIFIIAVAARSAVASPNMSTIGNKVYYLLHSSDRSPAWHPVFPRA